MDAATLTQILDDEGALLLQAADKAGLRARVPTCPDWQVRDLLQHIGQVHRWALSYVSTGRATPPDEHDRPATPPADDELLAWVSEGHAAVVSALRDASDDLSCWAFLPAASPRAFWARRQAHETAIHRADAQQAADMVPPGYDGVFAADGIDELLFGFFARPRGRLLADPPVRLGLRATDTHDAWTMTIGPDGRTATRTATRDAASADCVVTGTASELYLLLWNRADPNNVVTEGDPSVLELWREKAKISWR